MSKKFVTFRGRRMIEGWPDKIAAAQDLHTYLLNGIAVLRIKYGDESDDWGADYHSCYDCAVEKGELHVPGCDAEECPFCHNAVYSCDCDIADE